jgi:hypothetical protein
MLWTLLSFGIILILVVGMILAAKLTDEFGHQSWEALGNCRRGAIRLAGRINLEPGEIFVPKGQREMCGTRAAARVLG